MLPASPSRADRGISMKAASRKIDWPRTLLRACRIVESSEPAPTLAELAAAVDVSGSELQRQFRSRLGISPHAYAQALQLHRLARESAAAGNALDAIYAAGFRSSSAAYDSARRSLGVSPARLQKPLRIGWWMGLSDLGWMLMAATERGICWLAFGKEPGAMLEEMRAAFPQATFDREDERLHAWFDQVRDFVLLPRAALDLPLDIQGTAFQARVWRALRDVPLGETLSYSELAERLERPGAARAVAAACASNRIALLIPCHRIIANDGRLAGYRWGLARKQLLLQREDAERDGGNSA